MTTFVTPTLQRSLSVVYRFYDAFFFPLDDTSPAIGTELDVTIPALQLSALRVESDRTYRFSALTLTHPPPAGVNLPVKVTARGDEYVSLEPILITLPRPLSVPVQRSDFLINQRLWPTTVVRPPVGETAIHGSIRSATAQPVNNLTVEIWSGPPVPPAGTPFTRSDARGNFLFRLPLFKGPAGSSPTVRIRLNGGAVTVTPATLPIVLGTTQVIPFDRP